MWSCSPISQTTILSNRQYRLLLAIILAISPLGHVTAQNSTLRFDAIRVAGNERLSDPDVLQICDISARRTYDETSLQEVVACLGQSGEFTGVSLGTEGRDLIITVQEAPDFTGFLDFSVSAESDRGVSVKLQIEDRDLFDQGYQGAFEVEVAREEKNARAALTRSNIWGSDWRGGITLSYSLIDYDDQSFSSERATFAPFLSYDIDEQQSFTFRAGVQFDRTFDVADLASPILQRDAGSRTSPFVSFEYDAVFLPGVNRPLFAGG